MNNVNPSALESFLMENYVSVVKSDNPKRPRTIEYNEDAITIKINRRKTTETVVEQVDGQDVEKEVETEKVTTQFRLGKNLVTTHKLIEEKAFDLSVPMPVMDSEGNPVMEDGKPKMFLAIGLMDNTIDMQPVLGRKKKNSATVAELIEQGKDFLVPTSNATRATFDLIASVYPQALKADRIEITLGDPIQLSKFFSSTAWSTVASKQVTIREEFDGQWFANFRFFGVPVEEEPISIEEANATPNEDEMPESLQVTESQENTDTEEVEVSQEVDMLDNTPATEEEITQTEDSDEVAPNETIGGWN